MNIKRKLFTFIPTLLIATFLVVTPIYAEDNTTTEAPVELNIGGEQVSAKAVEDITAKASAPTSVTATSYDPRTNNMVTSVKNQGDYGLCWDYSIQAVAESNLIRQGLANNTVDLSEIYYAYLRYSHFPHPAGSKFSNHISGDAFNLIGCSNNLSERPISCFTYESKYPFPTQVVDGITKTIVPENYWIDDAGLDDYEYKVGRAYYVKSKGDIQEVKKLIVNYGGTVASYYMNESFYTKSLRYYYTGDNAYYYPSDHRTNHAIEIVGWDDNYAATNFTVTPKGNGAWLIKNSWGYKDDGSGGNGSGYFWMSYYDATLNSITAINLVPKDTVPYQTKKYKIELGSSIDLANDLTDTQKADVKSSWNSTFTATSFWKNKYSIAQDSYGNTIMRWDFSVTSKSKELVLSVPDEEIREIEENCFNPFGGSVSTTIDGFSLSSDKLEISSDNPDIIDVSDQSKARTNELDYDVKDYGSANITISFTDPDITEGETLTKTFKVTTKKPAKPEPTPVTPPVVPVVVPTTEVINNTTTTTTATTSTTITTPATTTTTTVNRWWEIAKKTTETNEIVIGGVRYKVKGKTAYVSEIDINKAKTLTIQKTIMINGKKYKVTKIAKNAFAYVDVKKIVIKSTTIKSIGKNAFNVKNKSKLTITVPKKCKGVYKTMIEKSTKGMKTVK